MALWSLNHQCEEFRQMGILLTMLIGFLAGLSPSSSCPETTTSHPCSS